MIEKKSEPLESCGWLMAKVAYGFVVPDGFCARGTSAGGLSAS